MRHTILMALGAGIAFAVTTDPKAAEEAGDPQAGFDYAHTYC